MISEILQRINLDIFNREDFITIIDKIDKETSRYIKSHSANPTKIKILYGPSFSIYSPSFIHDRILANTLRLRGAQIIPIYCDAIQRVECNVWGGVWAKGEFSKRCSECFLRSERLWGNSDIPPIKLSSLVKRGDRFLIENIVRRLTPQNWVQFKYEDMPLGRWAKDILVNNNVVSDYQLINNHHFLGTSHIKNLLLLKLVYERILNKVKPDRVITNDSYYGMWSVLEYLSRRKKIHFYSNWIGGRQGTWCYAYNDAALNLNFSKPWKKFSLKPLHLHQKIKVVKWLRDRRNGKEMILDTASLADYKTSEFDLTKINSMKPTALLLSNVIWDLAALNKQIVFRDMIDWIVQTIKWFSKHPEYQLIIKPHPGEQHPSIPATKENVIDALNIRKIKLPPNVFVMSPKVKLTVYKLFPYTKVGLVHTTSVGFEMVANCVPVITTGQSCYRSFGFTYDPINKQDYFQKLEEYLKSSNKIITQQQKDLSYKFILFYNFHFYTKIDILNIDLWKVTKLKVKSLADILPGKRKHLDYIADSIIDGLPIISENRWPEES